MVPVAPRIVNDISYVTGINDASHFSWQAQYLVTLVALIVTVLVWFLPLWTCNMDL